MSSRVRTIVYLNSSVRVCCCPVSLVTCCAWVTFQPLDAVSDMLMIYRLFSDTLNNNKILSDTVDINDIINITTMVFGLFPILRLFVIYGSHMCITVIHA